MSAGYGCTDTHSADTIKIWELSRVLYDTFGDSRMYCFGTYRLIIEEDCVMFNDTKILGQLCVKLIPGNTLTVQFAGAKLTTASVITTISDYIQLISRDENPAHYCFLDLHPDKKQVINHITQGVIKENPEFAPDYKIIERIVINTLATMMV